MAHSPYEIRYIEKGKRPCRAVKAKFEMKKFTRSSAALAALLVAGMATTPICAEGKVYTPVSGTNTTFDTTIYMKDAASVPNVTFKYAVTQGTDQNADTAGKNLAVHKGNDGITSTGMPTIADITFTAGDAKTATDGTAIKKEGTVDFSGVKFMEPGVYRYVVTETGDAQGITHEDNNKKQEDRVKALDVYVTDVDGALKVSAYVMHDNETDKAAQLDESKKLDDKDTNFEHLLTTSDVELSKKVTGNQGSRDEYFQFTVKIAGADKGTKFIVDLANADKTTKTNGVNTVTHENPEMLTAGEDGTLTQDFWIQNGQSIKIQGLGGSTGYTVTEAENAYKTNIAVTGDTKNGEANIAAVDGKVVTDAAVSEDTVVAYTNDKSGAVPTGLIMSIGGPAAIALLGGVGLVTINARKKKEDEE